MTTKDLAPPFLPKEAKYTSNRDLMQQAAGAEHSLARAVTKRAEYSNLLDHTSGTTLCPNRKATPHKIQE
jgi:hypothetical protein